MSQSSYQQGQRSRGSVQSSTDEWVKKQNAIIKANQPGAEKVSYTQRKGSDVAKDVRFRDMDIEESNIYEESSTGKITESALTKDAPVGPKLKATESKDDLYHNLTSVDPTTNDFKSWSKLSEAGEEVETRFEDVATRMFSQDEKGKYHYTGGVWDKLRGQSNQIADPRNTGDLEFLNTIKSEWGGGAEAQQFDLSMSNVERARDIVERTVFNFKTKKLEYVPTEKDRNKSGVVLNDIINFSAKGVKNSTIKRGDYETWFNQTSYDGKNQNKDGKTLRTMPVDLPLYVVQANEDGLFTFVKNPNIPGLDEYLKTQEHFKTDAARLNSVLSVKQKRIGDLNPALFQTMINDNKSVKGVSPSDYTTRAKSLITDFQLDID